jgi:hypothetical protein
MKMPSATPKVQRVRLGRRCRRCDSGVSQPSLHVGNLNAFAGVYADQVGPQLSGQWVVCQPSRHVGWPNLPANDWVLARSPLSHSSVWRDDVKRKTGGAAGSLHHRRIRWLLRLKDLKCHTMIESRENSPRNDSRFPLQINRRSNRRVTVLRTSRCRENQRG